jgi:pilus assembly protein Flp/PilA
MLLSLYTRAKATWWGIRARIENEDGAVATEYALLLVLIALAIILGATALGIAINDKLQGAADTVSGVPGG